MQNDTTDRIDLYRLADDGCPNVTSDTKTDDLSELLATLAKSTK